MGSLADRLKGNKTEEVKVATVLPTVAEVSPVEEAVEEAKSDFAKSAEELEKIRDGRNESDIPFKDPYWLYRNTHSLAHGAHAVRVDTLDTIKGKPVDK